MDTSSEVPFLNLTLVKVKEEPEANVENCTAESHPLGTDTVFEVKHEPEYIDDGCGVEPMDTKGQNNNIVEATSSKGEVNNPIIDPSFATVKEEPVEDLEQCSEIKMEIEVGDIKLEGQTNYRRGILSNKRQRERRKIYDYTKLKKQNIALAHEILKHLDSLTSNKANKMEVWNEIATNLGTLVPVARSRWSTLKKSYFSKRESATAGSAFIIHRLQRCSLFNLMNYIVPTLDSTVEPWIPPEKAETKPTTDEASGIIYGSEKHKASLALAQLIYEQRQLWDRKLPGYRNSSRKNKSLNHVAAEWNKSAEETKSAWADLQCFYRTKKKRICPDDPFLQDPLFKLLDLMLSRARRAKSNAPTSDDPKAEDEVADDLTDYQGDANMKLILLAEKHDTIWNSRRPDYSCQEQRTRAWHIIAKKMSCTVAQVKGMWNRLRCMYRTRKCRLLAGKLAENDSLVQDPWYLKIDSMLKDLIKWPKFDKSVGESTEENSPGPSNENQLKLTLKDEPL